MRASEFEPWWARDTTVPLTIQPQIIIHHHKGGVDITKQYDRLLNPYLGATKQDMTGFSDHLWRLKMVLERVQRFRPFPRALWKHTLDDVLKKTRLLADKIHKRRGSDLNAGEKAIQLGPLRETVYKLEDMADDILYTRWKQQEGRFSMKSFSLDEVSFSYFKTNLVRRLRLILKLRKTQELLKDVQVIIEDFQNEYKSEEGSTSAQVIFEDFQEAEVRSMSSDQEDQSKNYISNYGQISAGQKDSGHVDTVSAPMSKIKAQLLQGGDIVIPFAVSQETGKAAITVYDIFQDEDVRENFGLLLRVRASDNSMSSVSHQGTLAESILKLMNSNVLNIETPVHTQKCRKCRPCLNTVAVEGSSRLEKGKGEEESEPEEMKELRGKFSQLKDGQEKFLLVLEDVLEDQLPQLVRLLSILLLVNSESRIVLSSQSSEVMQSVRGIEIRDGEIKHDIHGRFFRSFAFRDANEIEDEGLNRMAENMVGYLKKIPLAAKMVGKMLSRNHDHQFWAAILGKINCVHAECEHLQLSSLLKICYDELKAPLRLCFQYCSLFPNNWKFTSENLVQLWMSQGFLDEALAGNTDPQKVDKNSDSQMDSNSDSKIMGSTTDSEGMETLENLGNNYLKELCSRSFFEKLAGDGPRSFHRLHTSVHCFARFTAGEEFMRIESHIQPEESQHVRHLSLNSKNLSAVLNMEALFRLRTLIIFGPINSDDSENVHHILLRLKNTRTLVLAGCDMKTFPKLANDLKKHLRYLSIQDTEIGELPDDFCELLHLQVLNVQGSQLNKLPEKMTRLCNLRRISGPTFLTSTMNHIGKLKALQELEEFAVSRKHNIQELGRIKDIQGSISITNLEIVKCSDAGKARLHEKKSINSLKLEWSSTVTQSSSACGYSTLPKSRISAKVLERLKPNTDINILEINRYNGVKYPRWFSAGVFEKLESITLRNCKNLVEAPPFGKLPSLKRLMLETWDKLRRFPKKEGSGSSEDHFQKLIELSLEDMPELNDWEDGYQSFQCLKLLRIRNCPKLKNIPLLKSYGLEQIHLEGCQELSIVGDHLDAATYLPSTLLHLRITGCGKTKESKPLDDVTITSVEGDLTSLHTVHVDDISLLKPYYKRLVSLEELVIEGGIEDSLDSLTNTKSIIRKLCLIKCQDKALPKDMQGFSSLKCFHLKQCNEMESLPDLPYSLAELRIDECPLLKKHCREYGPGWSNISHIPYKYI